MFPIQVSPWRGLQPLKLEILRGLWAGSRVLGLPGDTNEDGWRAVQGDTVHSGLLETQMSMMCLPPLDLDTPGSYLYKSQHLISTHGSLVPLSVQGEATLSPMP